MKSLILFCFIIQNISYAQDVSKKEVVVSGRIPESRNNDTLFLSNGFIDTKFFEDSLVSSKVFSGKFSLKFNISYPHLFKINYASEKGDIIARAGAFFIDSTTTSIRIDSSECIKITGKTFEEYTRKFIPYMTGDSISCTQSTIESLSWNNSLFDKKLLVYTTENRDSYVALWALITRVNEGGHSLLYDSIAQSFSNELKAGKLWRSFYDDFQNIRIKENHKFPTIRLQNLNLKLEDLELPKAKFILVDYWFSRCKPCLESFPKLKEIYEKYRSKGFEIISISVDRANNIGKWKDRIEEFGLNWKHYLDENGVEAEKDKIFTFPTTFLLDEKGNLIKKKISIDELEILLEKNLK